MAEMEEKLYNLTPEELIRQAYPAAAECISSLATIGKTNSYCMEQVICLAMLIGINQAHLRLIRAERNESLDKFQKQLDDWKGFR